MINDTAISWKKTGGFHRERNLVGNYHFIGNNNWSTATSLKKCS